MTVISVTDNIIRIMMIVSGYWTCLMCNCWQSGGRVVVCRGHCSVVRPSQTKSDQPRSAQVQPTCPPENRFESRGD